MFIEAQGFFKCESESKKKRNNNNIGKFHSLLKQQSSYVLDHFDRLVVGEVEV